MSNGSSTVLVPVTNRLAQAVQSNPQRFLIERTAAVFFRYQSTRAYKVAAAVLSKGTLPLLSSSVIR